MAKSGVKVWLTRFALLELVVFVLVASWIGFLKALFIIILSSLYGSYRLKSRGMPYDVQAGKAWVARGKVQPATILFDFLWLIPGFLSSIMAIILLVPLFRKALLAMLLAWLAKRGFNFAAKAQHRPEDNKSKIDSNSHTHGKGGHGQTIDGEFKRRDD